MLGSSLRQGHKEAALKDADEQISGITIVIITWAEWTFIECSLCARGKVSEQPGGAGTTVPQVGGEETEAQTGRAADLRYRGHATAAKTQVRLKP